MTNKKQLYYEIHLENQTFQPIRGTIFINKNESIPSIREKIEKETNYRENTLIVQEPKTAFIGENVTLIVLKEQNQGSNNARGSQRGFQGSYLKKPSEEGSIFFQQESIIQRQNSQEFMYKQPQIPPKIIGQVQKCYKFFSCMSSTRIMVLNYQLVRLFTSPQLNSQPQLQIPLRLLKQITSYKKKSFFFLRLTTINSQQYDFKFTNKQFCKQWIQHFHNAMGFCDYLTQKRNYSRTDSYETFLKGLEEKERNGTSKVIKVGGKMEQQQIQKKKFINSNDKMTSPSTKKSTTVNPNATTCPTNTIIKSSSIKLIRLADFQVTHEIGKGAFSTVYKAERKGRIFALKQINKDKLIYQNQLKYAITQLNILRNCNNRCSFIVPLYYAFQTEDYLYLAIKYLPFGTLKSIVEKRGKFTQKQAILLVCELIIAIQFLHKNNILYRDMKPENILLTQEGHLYLIDFGLSIELSETEQFAESFVGTPLYLAPERLQGSGKINYKADIYGVGCMFYLMLHGHAPFEADSLASIIYNIKNTELKIREDLGDLTKDFLLSTLQTTVQKRLGHMSSHPLFQKIDWNKICKKQQQIMNLQIKNSTQFCGSTGTGDKDYTEENYPNKKINDWNYVDPLDEKN